MIAPIFLGAAVAWTPAACFVAFQTFLVVLSALQLITGQSDSFWKNEPHTEKLPSPEYKRAFEIGAGGALLHWAGGMTAALLAGGAQVMCIVNLAGMLLCTYYHYAAGGMANVKTNLVLVILMLYFGFGQALTMQSSTEWTSADRFLAFQATLCVLCSLAFLAKPDAMYDSHPHLKLLLGGGRLGELFEAGILTLMGGGIVGAVMAGGAQDMCILQLPGLFSCTYGHYVMGSKRDVAVNSIFIVILAYFGLAR